MLAFAACTDNPTVNIVSFSLDETTANLTFDVDEQFCYDAATIKAVFSDGTEKAVPVTADMVVGFDSTTTGTKSLTISYKGIERDYVYEVVYKKYPSREIVTAARIELKQVPYATGIGREVLLTEGLSGVRGISFCIKSDSDLSDSKLNTLDIAGDWEINAQYVGAGEIRLVLYRTEGFSSGSIATINFAGVTNAEIRLTDIVLSDGKTDTYLPDTQGV